MCFKKLPILLGRFKQTTMNIVLTGLRGSGKSKLGKVIAKKLNWEFIDLDKEIEKAEKMTIPEIIEKHDWEYFRKAEETAAKETTALDKTVIATGGGTIINETNAKALKKNGKIIYLNVSPEICLKRIKKSKNRPPLTNLGTPEEEIQHLYEHRHPIYTKTAAIVFDRSSNANSDAEEIIKLLF